MFNKAYLTLILALIALAPVKNVYADKAQIIEDVLNEKGFYDAGEIEKRIRFEALDSSLPEVEGELIDEGGCSGKDCYTISKFQSGSSQTIGFVPTLNGINGVKVGGNYVPELRVEFNINTISQSNLQLLQTFQFLVLKSNAKSKDGCISFPCPEGGNNTHTYKVYNVLPEFRPDGEVKQKQFLSTSDLTSGDYTFAIRAVYQGLHSPTYSDWSNDINATIFSHDMQLSQIGEGSLKSCLLNNGFVSTALVGEIDRIECSNQNLLDSDVLQISQYFSSVRYIDISNNPALTGIKGLGKLPHLQILDISENPNFNTANLGNFGDLDALIMRNMGQTNMVMPVPPHNATYVDYSGNHFASWQPIYEDRRDNAIQSLNLSNTNFATANVSTLLTPPSSGDVYISGINLSRNPSMTDVSSLVQIKGLEHVNVNNTSLTGAQDFTGISGLCSLSMSDTQVGSLRPNMPVQYLNLQNNVKLKNAQPIHSSEYRPHWTNLSDSNALKCHNFYKYFDNAQSGSGVMPLTDFSVLDPNNFAQPLPQCENQTTAVQYSSPDICKPTQVMSMNVYEDVNTSTRVIKWEPNPAHDYARWGVTHYQILAKIDDVIINSYAISLNSETIFTEKSLEANNYQVHPCTATQCGYSRTVWEYDFHQGLSRVEDVVVNWDTGIGGNDPGNQNIENYKLQFQFTYLNDRVSNFIEGKPAFFRIISNIKQHNGGFVVTEIPFVQGDEDYYSHWIDYDQLNGNSFTVLACNDYIGCGDENMVSFSTPIFSNDLAEVEWKTNAIYKSVEGNLVLNWKFKDSASTESIELVDYIEVKEFQPITVVNGNYKSFGHSDLQRNFYVDDLDGEIHLNRQAVGRYRYQLRACKRDREYGDSCSSFTIEPGDNNSDIGQEFLCGKKRFPDDSPNTFQCTSPGGYYVNLGVNYGVAGGKPIENISWYAPSNNLASNNKSIITNSAIQWQYNDDVHGGYDTPDYFYLTLRNGVIPNYSSCSDKPRLFIPYADSFLDSNDQRTWSTEAVCDNLGATEWKIQACYNGSGCVAHEIYDINANADNPGNPPVIVDPNDPILNNVVGGPSDFASGMWWNPEIAGTGWHFYWANELRHLSDNPGEYKKTYDLIGYWFAYREINGIWTPTWFEARLKQEFTNSSNPRGYFEGNLLYRDGSDSNAENIDVGHIKIEFEDPDTGEFRGNPRRAILLIDPDYSEGIFTNPITQGPYEYVYGQYLKLEIEDFNIDIMQGSDNSNYQPGFGGENDADFYSGMWQLNPQENGFSELTMLTSIKRSFEVTTFAYYDDTGQPIWVEGMTCGGPNCNRPGAGAFEDYVDDGTPQKLTIGLVPHGFNPLGSRPEWFDFGDPDKPIAMYVGKAGRNFEVGDPSDPERFNKGAFWLDINVNLVYELEDGDEFTRNIAKNFGGSTHSYSNQLTKTASLHGIDFEVNSPEIVDEGNVCDPNTNTSNECDIRFFWYTDQDFSTMYPHQDHAIMPMYSYKAESTSSWSSYQPLSNLCGNYSTTTYLVADYSCLMTQPGQYKFQLHKNRYDASLNQTMAIAESHLLEIKACNTAVCENVNVPLDAEPAPDIDDARSSIGADPLNDVVGTTSGAFDIDESGAANYSLPIFAPKGRGGLAPQLALSYNSQAGNGIAGQGWNISGTSAITRCINSIEHDSADTELKPIQLTWDDKFCLDGVRLYEVSSTATEVEYRTELANFSKIVAQVHPDYPNGPRKFTVYTKSGEVWGYGAPGPAFKAGVIFPSTDSTGAQIRVSESENTVHTWLLAQIADRSTGLNRIRFAYDTKDGESYLSTVRWSNFGSGQNPHYKIQFNYSDNIRSDASHYFTSGGLEIKNNRYLESVSTFIEKNATGASDLEEVRHLSLSYQDSNSSGNPTGVMRLISAQTCYQENQSCLQPVEFEWDSVQTEIGISDSSIDEFENSDIETLKEMGYGSYKPIDINGDGHMELIFVRGYDKGNWLEENFDARYWIAFKSSKFDGSASFPISECKSLGSPGQYTAYFDKVCNTNIQPFHADKYDEFNADKWFVYDFNGDGFQDILTPERNNDGDPTEPWTIFYSNGNTICKNNIGECQGYGKLNTGIDFHQVAAGSSLLDYTADGLPDLMTYDEIVENGNTIYKYRIYPAIISTNGVVFSSLSSDGSQLVDLDTEKLKPYDLLCSRGITSPGSPCMIDPNDYDPNGSGKLTVGKLEQINSDINGDGFNDALLTYKYIYHPSLSCDDYYDPDIIESENELTAFYSYSNTEYSAEPLSLTASGLNGFPGQYQRCEQTFKAIMTFNKDSSGNVGFKYAGRLGIVNPWSDMYSYNDSQPPFYECSGDSIESGCGAYINNKGMGITFRDVNGDGLSDIVNNISGGYYYRLNEGYQTSANIVVRSGLNGPLDVSFNKVIFSQSKEAVPFIPAGQGKATICNLKRNVNNYDACARSYLTQFIDYDLDGDMDIVVPKDKGSANTVYYQVFKYGENADGSMGYTLGETLNVPAYQHNNDRRPQDYNNAMWDINGDGHYDFFSLLRYISESGSDTNQAVTLGSNKWQTRNKITKINHKLGSASLKSVIEINYQAATNPASSLYIKSTGSLASLNYGNGSPVFDIYAPIYLVESVSKTAPTAGNPNAKAMMLYNYEGMKVQGGGRGSLGFAAIESIDTHHDIVTRTEYHQDFPYTGLPKSTKTRYGDNLNLLSESYNEYAVKEFLLASGESTKFPYLKRSYERTYNLNVSGDNTQSKKYRINSPSTSVEKVTLTDFIYNAVDVYHGNLTATESRVCKGSVDPPQPGDSSSDICGQSNNKLIELKITQNTYADNIPEWFLGRLSDTVVTTTRKSGNGYDTKTKHSSFSYHPTTGQLEQEIIHGDIHQYLRTVYEYDVYGQSTATFQCSDHFTNHNDPQDTSNCTTLPTQGRWDDPTLIHRFSQTVYDGEWQEFVAMDRQPYSIDEAFNHSETALLENANVPSDVLTTGGVPISAVSVPIFDPFSGDSGAIRDIYGNPYSIESSISAFNTRTVYGVFGEAHASATSTGAKSSMTKRWCTTSDCPDIAATKVTEESRTAPTTRKYYDALGREVRSQVQNFNGDWQTTDTEYDVLGRTIKQSEPYIINAGGGNGSSIDWTRTWFDPLDRVVLIETPNRCIEVPTTSGSFIANCYNTDIITYTEYQGLSVTTTNAKAQSNTQVFDETGQIIESYDANGEVVEYAYDAGGNLTETTSYIDNSPITITMGYDNLGRKTSMTDPDKGSWTYTYNAMGELIEQTSANSGSNASVKNWYDIRGRLYFRIDADGGRTVWDFDQNTLYGKPSAEHSRGHYQSHGVAQTKQFIYDIFGRPSETLTTVYDEQDSTTPNVVTYESAIVYDQYGRTFQQFDALNNAYTSDEGRPGLQFIYNDYGYQSVVRDAENGLEGQEYYRVLNVDQRGQVTHERHGGRFYTTRQYESESGLLMAIQSVDETNYFTQRLDYAFDEIGNLTRRTDYVTGTTGTQTPIHEVFTYDNLNRLEKVYRDVNNGSSQNEMLQSSGFSYDESGNLINKGIIEDGVYEWTLQYNGSKPHAVSTASKAGETKQYEYDNNGSVRFIRNGSGGIISELTYTSFDKVTEVTTEGETAQIFYNAGRSRYIRKDNVQATSAEKVTHYLGSVEYTYQSSGVKMKRHLGNLIIDIVDHENQRNQWAYHYLLKDHLGSTHTIVNKQGYHTNRFSFNAWGERRLPPIQGDGSQIYEEFVGLPIEFQEALDEAIEATTNRGFTGHEHFDKAGFIHMNGRIYDPTIGRFLQADPVIQDPYNTQSLNRYSYVMNNPLSFTDPSGYSRLRKGWWRVPVAIAISIYTAGAASGIMSLAGTAGTYSVSVAGVTVGTFTGTTAATVAFSTAIVGGAAAGGVASGNLKGAVKGGIMAAVTFGIGHGFDGAGGIGEPGSASRMFAHSMVGGVSAEIDGGQFGHGFLSSMVSQSIGTKGVFQSKNIVTSVVSNAILQGSISELTGGKFSNGAITAAFRVAFNDHLEFDGNKLSWFDDDKSLVESWPAESGLNKKGSIDDRMRVFGGPTPEGEYLVDPDLSNYDRWWKLGWGDPDVWGSVRTILKPLPGTETFGRTQMYIHGGTGGEAPGTLGCIDISLNNDKFHNMLREYNKPIKLTIDYNNQ